MSPSDRERIYPHPLLRWRNRVWPQQHQRRCPRCQTTARKLSLNPGSYLRWVMWDLHVSYVPKFGRGDGGCSLCSVDDVPCVIVIFLLGRGECLPSRAIESPHNCRTCERTPTYATVQPTKDPSSFREGTGRPFEHSRCQRAWSCQLQPDVSFELHAVTITTAPCRRLGTHQGLQYLSGRVQRLSCGRR